MPSQANRRSYGYDGGERAFIKARAETVLSPWVRLVQKDVEFASGEPIHTYHCFALGDYISILAKTPGDLIPIVRQYRPAVEVYTWELPAGMLEAGEQPVQSCVRELKEETGLTAQSVTPLGVYYSDTGRLENRLHAFYVEASEPPPDFVPECGMSVRYVTFEALKELIRTGQFQHQLHIAVLLLYELALAQQKS